MEQAINELHKQIREHLGHCCPDRLKSLKQYIGDKAGLLAAHNMIFEQCTSTGCSIQTAMSAIDTELRDNQ